MVVPSPMTYGQRVVKPPFHHHPPVVASSRVVPVPVKLGPAVVRPGFNTFQPGVFRGRSRVVVASPGAFPMFTPLLLDIELVNLLDQCHHLQDVMDLVWEMFLEIDQKLLNN